MPSLGSLCLSIVDCEHKTAPAGEGSAFSVGTKDIRNGRISFSTAKRISDATYEEWTRRAAPATGDILLAREAPVGEVARIPEGVRVALGQRTVLLRPDPRKVEPRFLLCLLRSPEVQHEMQRLAAGSTVPHLNVSEIRDLALPPLPSQDAQDEIASLLAATDDKIRLNERLCRRLERLADLLVAEATSDETDTRSVYDFASVVYGQPFKSALFGAEGTPVLRIRDLAAHNPDVATTEVRPRARLIQPGEVVVGMDGEFRAHIWHGPTSLLNQRVCLFEPLQGVSRAFVWRGIKDPLAFFESTKTGTTVIHLGKADIDTFRLPVVKADAMRSLAERADPLLDLCVQLRRETRRLTALETAVASTLDSNDPRLTGELVA